MSHILYSFRRCPYAMRARLALQVCLPQASLELREVVLKNKPQAMLDISPKATVPVLQLTDGQIIDESLDIMFWAFKQNPELMADYLPAKDEQEIKALISLNDGDFKWALDRYKYADRHEYDEDYYREKAEPFLLKLESRLSKTDYLAGEHLGFLDLAIFPFVRQFAHVDKKWFEAQTQYLRLQAWLAPLLEGELFTSIMKKYSPWSPESEPLNFPE